VESSSIRAAYLPFARTLRKGGFAEPAAGWNAGQIAAHISLSNEQFSELADRLRDGEDVRFDNTDVSDPERLLGYVAEHGELAGLADAIEASAGRLSDAYERLTPAQRERPIPVRIWHEGQIARDSPMAIGELILGNGDYHLAMHHKQLQDLRE
jgi:DinB family protein